MGNAPTAPPMVRTEFGGLGKPTEGNASPLPTPTKNKKGTNMSCIRDTITGLPVSDHNPHAFCVDQDVVKKAFMEVVDQVDLHEDVVEHFFRATGIPMPQRRIEMEVNVRMMVVVIAGRGGVPADVDPDDLPAQIESIIEDIDEFDTIVVRSVDPTSQEVEWV